MSKASLSFSPDRLRVIRKEHKLTQRALAATAGISQSLIAELERGKHPPSKLSLEKIALALKTDTEAFHE
jgi:transcriptional regulator with XRE-family HTH domain